MTAHRIEIRDDALQAALGRLLALGERPDPILDAIGRQLKTNVQLGFIASTDPYGRPWAPLKIRQGQPLRDKGHLMNSIDYRVDGNAVEVGTNREHVHVHQYGATIKANGGKLLVFRGPDGGLRFAKSVTIPARPFLPLDGLPQAWRDDVLDVLSEATRGAWSG